MNYQLQKIIFIGKDISDINFLNLCCFRLEEEGIEYEVISIIENGIEEEIWKQRKTEKNCLWVTNMDSIGRKLLEYKQFVLFYEEYTDQRNEIQIGELPAKESQQGSYPYILQGLEDVDAQYFERIYRRLKKIPWDILETDRLIVRESVLEDLPFFYEIYQDKRITQYMEDLFEDPEMEAEYLKSYIDTVYAFYETGIYTVVYKETGEIIGRAGYERREGYEELEFGFLISTKYQKRGLAKEVCTGLLQYAAEYFPKEPIHAFVEPENEISIKLLESLGFHYVSSQKVATCKEKEKNYLEYYYQQA